MNGDGTCERPTSRLFTVPNAITVARLAALPAILSCAARGAGAFAAGLAAAAAASDFLDGYLARRLGAVSRLGVILDPLADRLLVLAMVVAGVWLGNLAAAVAWALALREVAALGGYAVFRALGARLEVSAAGKRAAAATYAFLLASLVVPLPAAVGWAVVALYYATLGGYAVAGASRVRARRRER